MFAGGPDEPSTSFCCGSKVIHTHIQIAHMCRKPNEGQRCFLLLFETALLAAVLLEPRIIHNDRQLQRQLLLVRPLYLQSCINK
jgi:hypothetical protein